MSLSISGPPTVARERRPSRPSREWSDAQIRGLVRELEPSILACTEGNPRLLSLELDDSGRALDQTRLMRVPAIRSVLAIPVGAATWHARGMRLALALWILGTSSQASAQRLVAHDTLSDMTPSVVSCGFCVGEAIGVVFRELPSPLRGIDPDDFPLELREVQIALASSRTIGSASAYTCESVIGGGNASVDIEVWAGSTPPAGNISALPTRGMPWPNETLVWGDTVSITLSEPAPEGTGYRLNLNRLEPLDAAGARIVVPPPATYLRVVAWLGPGGMSTLCEASALEAPRGLPINDAPAGGMGGVIANERSFLYAASVGWLWNENAGVTGDWGIRVVVLDAMTPRDAGAALPDSGSSDAGQADSGGPTIDAALASDASPASSPAPGCGCRTSASGNASLLWLGVAACLLVSAARARGRLTSRRRHPT